MRNLFLFGTLLDPELRGIVLGRDAGPVRPARLNGHVARQVTDGQGAAIVPDPDASVDGLCAGSSDRARFYLSGLGAREREVVLADGTAAVLYDLEAGRDAWSLSDWQATQGRLARAVASRAMRGYGQIGAGELSARLSQIRSRVFSELRAADDPAPTELRASFHRDRIEVDAHRIPYQQFFAVGETDLRHPLYGGGQSETMTRAGFHSGDAVTVLPYDPVRDRVLVIEQFRYGPWLRGDPHPWCLEPIAGRIDPGEDAEKAVRREAQEEAGITLGRLHRIGGHYPSPGVLSEYLDSYVAEADLPDGAGGIGGLDAEHEDIRAHVIPFDRLMALLDSGEAETGPLILSALWLARARDRRAFA